MYKCTAGLLYSLTRWWRQVEVGWAGFLQVSRGGVGWSVGRAGGPEQAGREPSAMGVRYQLMGVRYQLVGVRYQQPNVEHCKIP